ncbi:MAG: anti-sigma factor [Chloroflexi bacterium]|nr:anti-sigma factor [Chloroflexota bacterium]
MTCAEAGELIPALALDALDEDEGRELDRHLARCRSCRAELTAFRETAGHLATAVPMATPSPDLRRRTLTVAAASDRSSALARVRAWWPSWPTVGARLSSAIAAAALVLSLGTTLWAASAQVSLDRQMAENRLLAEQLASRDQLLASLLTPGAEVRELRAEATAPGAQAVLLVNRQSRGAVLSASGLPRLPADRVYQLWLIQDGQRTSGGIFTTDARGGSRLEVFAPQPLGAYSGFGVTIEPSGGSPGPTGARVLAGAL